MKSFQGFYLRCDIPIIESLNKECSKIWKTLPHIALSYLWKVKKWDGNYYEKGTCGEEVIFDSRDVY